MISRGGLSSLVKSRRLGMMVMENNSKVFDTRVDVHLDEDDGEPVQLNDAWLVKIGGLEV